MPLPPYVRIGFDELDNPIPDVPSAESYSLHENVCTLGEVYDICRTLPPNGKFVMIFYDKVTNKFLQADEAIFNIIIDYDKERLCLISGYHSECKNIINRNFISSCDPNHTGKIYRSVSKNGVTWVINENTPLIVDTKRHGFHTINDVISFEDNGQQYVGFVSNVVTN